jgi:hypothetical protein
MLAQLSCWHALDDAGLLGIMQNCCNLGTNYLSAFLVDIIIICRIEGVPAKSRVSPVWSPYVFTGEGGNNYTFMTICDPVTMHDNLDKREGRVL